MPRAKKKAKKRKNARVPRTLGFPALWASVADDYLTHQNYALAAVANGISVGYCRDLLMDQRVKDYITKIEPEFLAMMHEEKSKERVLNRKILDETFVKVLYGKRATMATAKMFEVGYKVTGDIQPPKIVQNQQQGQGVSLAGANAFEVYESKWLRERKHNMSKLLEEKHSGPGELAPHQQ